MKEIAFRDRFCTGLGLQTLCRGEPDAPPRIPQSEESPAVGTTPPHEERVVLTNAKRQAARPGAYTPTPEACREAGRARKGPAIEE